jgi:hypothetical protein
VWSPFPVTTNPSLRPVVISKSSGAPEPMPSSSTPSVSSDESSALSVLSWWEAVRVVPSSRGFALSFVFSLPLRLHYD